MGRGVHETNFLAGLQRGAESRARRCHLVPLPVPGSASEPPDGLAFAGVTARPRGWPARSPGMDEHRWRGTLLALSGRESRWFGRRGGSSCRGDAVAPRQRSSRALAASTHPGRGEGRRRTAAFWPLWERRPSPGSQGEPAAPFRLENT